MATPKNRSIQKAFNLLRAFRNADEWLTSAELSRRARMPEASGYRLVQTLEEIGAIVRGPEGRYRPGLLLLNLSRNVRVGELLRDSAHGILRDLANRLSLTVHMGVLEDGMVTYVAKVGQVADFAVHTRVGAQLEAYCSGLGKVLLAALPEREFEAFLAEGEFVALTPYTITEVAAFRREIAQVRTQDFAIDDREISANLRCVAVPMRDGEGRVIAAISVSDDADRMTLARQQEVCRALRAASFAISRKMFPGVALQAA